MKAHVIIPTYRGLELLRAYLPSVIDRLGLPVTVIDDGSDDGSADAIRAEFPNVDLIARSSNGGFSAAANDGIGSADADLIVLLNNDVLVDSDFVAPILPLFEDGSVFAVTPSIIVPSLGGIDEGCKTAYVRHGIIYTDQRQGVDKVCPSLYATGCAAVYRGSMLRELGGFDEAYSPFYYEDLDLGYRAWKRGWRTLYQPAGRVTHLHSFSISRMDSRKTARIRARNLFLFIARNIDDPDFRRTHGRWLPFVLARRLACGDTAFADGWRDAWARRDESKAFRLSESAHRALSDREIAEITRVEGVERS